MSNFQCLINSRLHSLCKYYNPILLKSGHYFRPAAYEQCYITQTMWSRTRNERRHRTLCLNYVIKVYYISCIYNYPNYHNCMYYIVYSIQPPQSYVFLMEDISEQQGKQRALAHLPRVKVIYQFPYFRY
jgi:hypothetical protein